MHQEHEAPHPEEATVDCAYVSELPSTPGLGKHGDISERNLFDILLVLNSSLNPNTLHNMSCKNF
jgi:hypothetical protein